MLNQTTTYAVRAMAYLAKHDSEEAVLAKTISQEMDIPRNFLSKIMNRLVREGLVASTRGTGGGFRLACDPKTITLRKVMEPFMDLGAYKNCFLGMRACDGSCGMHDRWIDIARKIEAMVDYVTIDEVL